MPREEGPSDFVYHEGEDLSRFPNGRFAFSREWAGVDISCRSEATLDECISTVGY